MKCRIRSIGVAVAVLALIGACGSEPTTGDEPPAAPAASTVESEPAAEEAETTQQKPKAPSQLRFSAKTLDGKEFSGTSLVGKPAVLWFWAPWCPNCQREAPSIAKAAGEHGEKVTFVGVAAQDQLPAMKDFASKYGIDAFTNLNDANAAVWAKFGVTYQPAFAFIGADGKIDVVKGTLSPAELDQRLKSLSGS